MNNRRHIARAHLVVTFYELPSTGVGQELEIAASFGRPTILLIDRHGTRRKKISTMVSSSFGEIHRLIYEDLADLRAALPELAQAVAAPPPPRAGGETGAVVRRRREQLGLSVAELARRSHCSPTLLVHLEQDPPDTVSLSQSAAWALASVLDVEASTLLMGTEATGLDRRVLAVGARAGRSAHEVEQVLRLAARDLDPAPSDEQIERLFTVVAAAGASS